ncbi:MAG: metal ABC transporter ATP-binding protein [Saprospiraceae bacterium]
MQKPIVEVHNLTVSYHQKPVLWDVDFSLPEGKLIAIVGPNGSGKTTLLKSIMGLVPLSGGFVRLFDQPLDEVRSQVSYVPQRETVDWDFPAQVKDVVLMGRYRPQNLLRRLTKADREVADWALKQVRMQEFATRQISQLSGGQQQRVFIARSLAQQASLYLMDEPFAGVDAASEKAILDILLELREKGKTLLIVHHDLNTVRQYFDWVVLMNTRLVAAGPADEVLTETNLHAAYGGQLNVLSQVADRIRAGGFPVREKEVKS